MYKRSAAERSKCDLGLFRREPVFFGTQPFAPTDFQANSEFTLNRSKVSGFGEWQPSTRRGLEEREGREATEDRRQLSYQSILASFVVSITRHVAYG